VPAEVIGNEKAGWVLAPLLPPLGWVHVCESLPFAVAPEGVVPRSDPRPIGFCAQLRPAAAGREVRAGGRLLARLDSAARATETAAWLAELNASPPKRRETAIRERIARSLDVAAIREEQSALRERAAGLRVTCNALFVLFAVVAPWQVYGQGIGRTWPWLVAGMVGLIAWVVRGYLRAHRELQPALGQERRVQSVALALAPLGAVRAVDALARGAHAGRHPLAVGHAPPRPAAARELARRELLEARHPIRRDGIDDGALRILRWFDDAMAGGIERALAGCGIDVAGLLAAPPREDPSCESYCPRCRAQYRAGVGSCGDCPGVALVAFAAGDAQGFSAGRQAEPDSPEAPFPGSPSRRS
jgi:hypothetical protein